MIAGQILGSELAGPAAGGWLFGLAAVLPFAVNTGTLGIGVLLLLTLPAVFAPPARNGDPGTAPRRLSSAGHDLGDGLRWVRQDPGTRDVMIMTGVVCAMDAAWFAVFVLYVTRILHEQAAVYGLLLAIGAVGGIVAGGAGAALTRRIGPWRSLLAAGLALAVSQAGLGLTGNVLVAGLVGNVVIAAWFMMIGSAAFALFNMTVVTMRQREVPDALLGRVTSVYFTVAMGTEALGAIVGGGIAAAVGIRALMLIGAGPIAVVTVFVTWRHRDAGRLPRPKAAR
jgi:predicted MFS family arabinose efflux permease